MCDAVIYDSLYRGPWGHAPARLCLECWLGQWEQMVQRMQAGGDWTGIDAALSLLCAGYSLRQTAGILGRARKTLVRSLRRALHSFEALPEWFVLRLERRSGEVRDVR
jgi:hypothetical protein